MDDNIYKIYQLYDSNRTRHLLYESFAGLHRAGARVNRNNYEHIYTGRIDYPDRPARTLLESLHFKFSHSPPGDFTGRLLNVSDVIVLLREGTVSAYYVDEYRFKEAPDFRELRAGQQNHDHACAAPRQLEAQLQAIGKWENSRRIPESSRITYRDPESGAFTMHERADKGRVTELYGKVTGAIDGRSTEPKRIIEQLAEASVLVSRSAPPHQNKSVHSRDCR